MSVEMVPPVVFEVFTKPRCGQCEATVRLLDSLDAVVGIVDAPEYMEMLRAEGFSEAPVVKVYRPSHEGVLDQWSGFRPDRIKAHLGVSRGRRSA
ncbi:glutaredoxin domain-containing protein [Actinomyces culturomici]|uniref:glutaredoxin domain-containing protein n=1 Tax=Actinomyces culturomici TaxID=1926276 RepID=UPI001F157617|nr:glutaredoxin domain-containing protein [Actinomyces culturomici]